MTLAQIPASPWTSDVHTNDALVCGAPGAAEFVLRSSHWEALLILHA